MYECTDLQGVAFIAKFDIFEFIQNLDEPNQSMCRDFFNGTPIEVIANQLNISRQTALTRIKKAMAPIAVQYNVRNARKFTIQNNSMDK